MYEEMEKMERKRAIWPINMVTTPIFRRLPMFKIVRFPKNLQSFFHTLKPFFLWQHHEYFQTLVLLTAIAYCRRNIAALYRHLDSSNFSHRSRFNNFLNVSRWDPQAALLQKAHEQLAALGLAGGMTVHLIIDDSKKLKRGKNMQAVSRMKDHVSGQYILGHQYVQAVLRFAEHTIPLGVRLYVSKSESKKLGATFKKTTELAVELIESFIPPAGVKVIVLFDSYYLCKAVTAACKDKGFVYISTLKSNRNLFKGGRKLKAAAYGKNLWRTQKRQHARNGNASYHFIDAGILCVGDIGEHRVVFSRKNSERTTLGIVTNDTKMKPDAIIRNYSQRWWIEVFFKDAKQLLGLGQYQNRSIEAAVTHLHLVCFAFALLTHVAIMDGRSAKAKTKKTKKAESLSTQKLQNRLRQIVWKDTAGYLKDLKNGDKIVKELSRLLWAA
jgi:SRSO17 transposase